MYKRQFLSWLHAPENIIRKAPSAGLFEGQTDEQEMGVTYAAIDRYILTGEANEHVKAIIDRYQMCIRDRPSTLCSARRCRSRRCFARRERPMSAQRKTP